MAGINTLKYSIDFFIFYLNAVWCRKKYKIPDAMVRFRVNAVNETVVIYIFVCVCVCVCV